jgi:outer membrane protein assembly factor BamB
MGQEGLDRVVSASKALALLLTSLFLALLLTAVPSLAQTSTPAPASTQSPAPTPTMLWQFTPYNYLGPGKYSVGEWSTPTIVEGVVYVDMSGSRNYDKVVPYYDGVPGQTQTINVDESWGGVYALNASTGKLRWFFTGQGTILSPAVGDDIVFAPLSYHVMGAFNISNGWGLWNHTLAVPDSATGYYSINAVSISASPSFSDGRVFFGLSDGNVIALNASTGKTVWTFAADSLYQPGNTISNDNAVRSTPVVNGVVYASSIKGYHYALNATTGSKLWSYSSGAGGFGDSAPVVAGGRVYFSANDRDIYSLNVTDGAKEWNYTCGYEWVSTPNYDNSYVFVSALTIDDNVVFFNYKGVVGWKDGSYKYFGVVCALNALSGVKLWNNTMDSYTSGAPTAYNGVIYVFSDDQHLYALNARNGEILWNYYVGKSVSSSKIENNVAYYGPETDNLYALKLPFEPVSSPNSTPTVPEFSWLAVLPLLALALFAAGAIKRSKFKH